jgi:putative phosphoribosyl transferase
MPMHIDALRAEVDEVVSLSIPEPFCAIGIHYADFRQMSDAEVIELLAEAGERPQQPRAGLPAETQGQTGT